MTVGRSRHEIDTYAIDVVMNARGDTAVIWTVSNGTGWWNRSLMVAVRSHRRWVKPKLITRGIGSLPSLHAGMTARGVVVLAWVAEDGAFVESGDAHRWSGASKLGAGPVSETSLDVDPNGRAAAAWVTYNDLTNLPDRRSVLMVSRRSVSGSWTQAAEVPGSARLSYPSGTAVMFPHVAVGRDGQAVSTWIATGFPLSEDRLAAAEYRPSAGWSSPRTVQTVRGGEYDVGLDMNRRGGVVLGWSNLVARHQRIFVTTRTATGSWSRVRPLSAVGSRHSPAFGPRVAITGGGQVFASWYVPAVFNDPTEYGYDPSKPDFSVLNHPGVDVATGLLPKSWRRPVRVSRARAQISAPFLAVADGPHAVIGWTILTKSGGVPQVSVSR